MQRQLTLLKEKKYAARKVVRPISIREYNHVVLKARLPVLRLSHWIIKNVLIETQKRFGLKLRNLAIMPDHCHLIVQVGSRKQFQDSLRFFAGQVALRLKRGRIWRERAWSRMVKYGKDLAIAMLYVSKNPFKAGIATMATDSFYIANGILFGELRAPPGKTVSCSEQVLFVFA